MKILDYILILVFLVGAVNAQEYTGKSPERKYILRKEKPRVSLNIRFTGSDFQNSVIRENGSGIFYVEVVNQNMYELLDLSVSARVTNTNDFIFDNSRKNIGNLGSGSSRSVDFKVTAGSMLSKTQNKFEFVLEEPSTGVLATESIFVNTDSVENTEVSVKSVEVWDNNLDGFIEEGEGLVVYLTLENSGDTYVSNVNSKITIVGTDSSVQLASKNIVFGTLPAGEVLTRQVDFPPVDINSEMNLTITDNDIPILKKIFKIKDLFKNELANDIPQSHMRNPNSIAVIIGNSQYEENDVPDVAYSVKDARLMKEYLIKMMGYEEDNIIYINNAKLSDFNAVFGIKDFPNGRLARKLTNGNNDIFIYYSGHGAPDIQNKTGYLVAVDSKLDEIASTGFALDTFYDNLSKLTYKSLTVVIDACFSGYSDAGALIQEASPLMMQIDDPSLKLKNAVVFTSSSGNEISSWYPEKKHSLFTYYFLKGMRDGANLFGTSELKVSSLKTYVQDEVSKYAMQKKNRKQTPQVNGDENTVLIEY